jgi:hypothetical protein
LEGEIRLPDRWRLPALGPGECVLLPAEGGEQEIAAADAKLLRITVP